MLAAILFAFSGHGWQGREKPRSRSETQPANDPLPAIKPVNDPAQHAAQFAVERMMPVPGKRTPLVVILAHYERWCMALHTQPLPEAQITDELCRLFREQGYQ